MTTDEWFQKVVFKLEHMADRDIRKTLMVVGAKPIHNWRRFPYHPWKNKDKRISIGETRWESCGKLFLEALRKGMEAAEKGFPPEIVFRKRKMAAKENTDGISAGEDRNEQSR